MKKLFRMAMIVAVAAMSSVQVYAQMGTRFPSERKVMKDPVTGVELIFLTNKAGSGDSKTYHTHNQWTADGNWHIFRSGRVQGNYWHNDEVIFCWETGGKAATRMWAMDRDGSNFRPLYRELETDWITHESVISADEIAFAVLGHRPIRMDHNEPPMDAWGISGTREYATGLAIVNMRTREFELVGQALDGNNVWFAQGSDDRHWALGEDFNSNLWIFDRHNKEVRLLTTGHKTNIRPSFSPDNTMVSIQSSMLLDKGLGICIVKLPQELLDRYNK